MDIIVQGSGEKTFKPDKIEIYFTFKEKMADYSGVLQRGVNAVEQFLQILSKLGFDKSEFKTRSFRIYENEYYDQILKRNKSDGFVFEQVVILKLDYDMTRLASLMNETSQLLNPPTCRIVFGLKDEKSAVAELLDSAYKDALSQAEAIAAACGKKIVDCVKTSFQPFNNNEIISGLQMSADSHMVRAFAKSADNGIQNILVPEDIVLKKEIYCLFTAE